MNIHSVFSDPQVLRWSFFSSLIMFIAISAAVPLIVLRLPKTYFLSPHREPGVLSNWHPWLRLPILIAKNLLALLCIIAGFLMLVLPGQGVLTIVVGFLLLDFPGKFRVERWFVSKPFAFKLFNRIRKVGGKAPFLT